MHHVAAWNRPSHTMLRLIAAMVTGGRTADPMLCHCAIWCSAMPSANPPSPMPRITPAVSHCMSAS